MSAYGFQFAGSTSPVVTVVDFVAMSAFSRSATGTFEVDGISAEVVEFTSTSVEVTAAGLGQTGTGLVRIEFDMADLDADFDETKPWEIVIVPSTDSGGWGVSIGADTNNRCGAQRQKNVNDFQALIVVAGSTTGTVTFSSATAFLALAAHCAGGRIVQLAYDTASAPASAAAATWGGLATESGCNTGIGASLGGAKLHIDLYSSTATKIETVTIRNYR